MRKWISLLLFATILLNLVMVAPVVSADPVDLEALRVSTNLYANPGFNLTDGALTGWNDASGILTPTTDSNGNSYVKVNHVPFNYYYSNPRMTVKSERYYLFFTKMKWVEGNDKALFLYGYPENVLLDSAGSSVNKSVSSSGDGQWKTAQVVVKAAEDRDNVSPMVVCWGQGEFYIDDIYLGELFVADIDCQTITTTAVIPKDNEPAVEIPLSAKALNQAGNEEGLGSTDAPITWTLLEAKQGVKIENNTLIIDSKASSDTKIKLKASCNPAKLAYQLSETNTDLKTAYLAGREKTIEITLTPNDYTLPRAVDIVINGSPTPGTQISCDYTYAQVTGEPEGTTDIQWYYKTPEAADYELISGATAREFDIPSDYPVGCAFLVKIKPRTSAGTEGETYTSAALVDPMAPIAKDVKIISPFEGDYAVGDVLTAKYTYVDGNDFGESKEGASVITWYRLDRDVEVPVGTGLTYQLTAAEADHYVFFKVKPISLEEPNAETEYPAEQMIWVTEEHHLSQETILQVRRDETNLLTNASFEDYDATTKKPTDWSVDEVDGQEWTGRLKASNEKAYRGTYSGKVTTAVLNGRAMTYGQPVVGEPQKTYLVSAMALPAASGGAKWVMYSTPEGSSSNTPTSTYTEPTTGAPEWTRLTNIVKNTGNSNISVRGTVICWIAGNTVYVDDCYIGELIVADIDCSETETTATIPKKGEPNVEIELLGTAYNQLGTLDGFTNGEAPITWSLKTEKQGVSVEGNKLIITDMATSDTKVKVLATCNPTFLGADTQTSPALLAGRTKTVEITLVPNENDAPRVENARIEGTVAIGETLECKYDYTQVSGELESGTEIKWYYKEVTETEYRPFEPEVTGASYVVASGYEDKHIIAKITPKSETGKVGTTVSTPYVVYPKTPEIKDGKVTITGKFAVGQTLTASYIFFDDNGDEEGATTYRWVRFDGETETPLGTDRTYTVTESDIDKKICVYVTPVSTKAPESDGVEYASAPVLAAARPIADRVSVDKLSSSILGAKYTYSHPCDIPQGATICEWYVNGTLVHTGTTFNASDYKGYTVTLKVTPVATLMPFEGATISASYDIPKKTNGGGAGGGPSISRVEVTTTPTPAPEAGLGNIVKYPEWMRPGIQFALSNDIMSNVSENEFMPEQKIKRADFLRCVMKTLGLEESEYTGIFGDVSSSDSISGYLQTAVDKGIISRDDNFYPNRNVSRAEICKILIAGVKAAYPDADIVSADLAFADAGQIQEWAYGYVQQAVGIKLLNGMSETEFAPFGDVTRAQTATMVMRLHQFAETKKGDE